MKKRRGIVNLTCSAGSMIPFRGPHCRRTLAAATLPWLLATLFPSFATAIDKDFSITCGNKGYLTAYALPQFQPHVLHPAGFPPHGNCTDGTAFNTNGCCFHGNFQVAADFGQCANGEYGRYTGFCVTESTGPKARCSASRPYLCGNGGCRTDAAGCDANSGGVVLACPRCDACIADTDGGEREAGSTDRTGAASKLMNAKLGRRYPYLGDVSFADDFNVNTLFVKEDGDACEAIASQLKEFDSVAFEHITCFSKDGRSYWSFYTDANGGATDAVREAWCNAALPALQQWVESVPDKWILGGAGESCTEVCAAQTTEFTRCDLNVLTNFGAGDVPIPDWADRCKSVGDGNFGLHPSLRVIDSECFNNGEDDNAHTTCERKDPDFQRFCPCSSAYGSSSVPATPTCTPFTCDIASDDGIKGLTSNPHFAKTEKNQHFLDGTATLHVAPGKGFWWGKHRAKMSCANEDELHLIPPINAVSLSITYSGAYDTPARSYGHMSVSEEGGGSLLYFRDEHSKAATGQSLHVPYINVVYYRKQIDVVDRTDILVLTPAAISNGIKISMCGYTNVKGENGPYSPRYIKSIIWNVLPATTNAACPRHCGNMGISCNLCANEGGSCRLAHCTWVNGLPPARWNSTSVGHHRCSANSDTGQCFDDPATCERGLCDVYGEEYPACCPDRTTMASTTATTAENDADDGEGEGDPTTPPHHCHHHHRYYY